MKNFLPLDRRLLKHWLWQDKPFSKGQAWIDLLLLANYKDKKTLIGGKIVVLRRGDVNLSLSELSQRWGWDRRTVRKFLSILESDNMLSVRCTTKCTTITIENYNKYNIGGTAKCTNKSQMNVQQDVQLCPTTKKGKKDNNINKECVYAHARGDFQNIFLTDGEYNAFISEFQNANEMIQALSNYKARKGIGNSGSDYAMLLHFAKTDGIRVQTKSEYKKYLAEAKVGFEPPEYANLTADEFAELKRIADERSAQ